MDVAAVYLEPVEFADRMRGPKCAVVPRRARNLPGAVIDWGNWSAMLGTLSDVAGPTLSSASCELDDRAGPDHYARRQHHTSTGSRSCFDLGLRHGVRKRR